jgi:hypothetical protein
MLESLVAELSRGASSQLLSGRRGSVDHQETRHRSARSGNARWRHLTEIRLRTAKSCSIPLDVPGSVAKSTHARLPGLLQIRQQFGRRVTLLAVRRLGGFSKEISDCASLPKLWSDSFPPETRSSDQRDAEEWMRRKDRSEKLAAFLEPGLRARTPVRRDRRLDRRNEVNRSLQVRR